MLLALAQAAPAQTPVDAAHWPDDYDRYFQKYTKHYFGPFWDWRWFKAQAIVESTLEKSARNPSGAVGLMQVTPQTFAEIRRSETHMTSIHEPRWNIAAGIYYDHYLYSKTLWDTLDRRVRLLASFAAYNAGFSRAADAYRATPKPITSWLQMAPRMPRQTRRYVDQIVLVKTGHKPHAPVRKRGIFGQLFGRN